MPLIQLKLIEGVLTTAQKKEFISSFTDTTASIMGENIRPLTWVVIDDVHSGEWGIGGQALTTEDVHTLLGSKK